MSDLPILQIIHVTDLHVKANAANSNHNLNGWRRITARGTQHMIERFDLFDWNEGTQGNYPKANKGFQRFLQEWRETDGRWYGTPDNRNSARTWLIDTGDLTAYGDDDSLTLGQDYLANWRAALGNCELRSLFGNHDAWPEMLPIHTIIGYLRGEINAQQQKIAKLPEWNTTHWLNNPLSIEIPGPKGSERSRIELYALNTVLWGAVVNTLALGNISKKDVKEFRNRLRSQWTGSKTKHFRILAMHHPLAFPYTFSEKHSLLALPSMALWRADKWAREFRNDRNDPQGLGPLAHLFLSGHTHISYPAGKLPHNVGDIHQGPLGSAQLQLVGGTLMLNKSASAARKGIKGQSTSFERKKLLYVPGMVNTRNCQAQILRFYADPNEYGQLTMVRIPIRSTDGSNYVMQGASVVKMYYDTP